MIHLFPNFCHTLLSWKASRPLIRILPQLDLGDGQRVILGRENRFHEDPVRQVQIPSSLLNFCLANLANLVRRFHGKLSTVANLRQMRGFVSLVGSVGVGSLVAQI